MKAPFIINNYKIDETECEITKHLKTYQDNASNG